MYRREERKISNLSKPSKEISEIISILWIGCHLNVGIFKARQLSNLPVIVIM
jgi:hypothetical protein